jgi:hypothetical protein
MGDTELARQREPAGFDFVSNQIIQMSRAGSDVWLALRSIEARWPDRSASNLPFATRHCGHAD